MSAIFEARLFADLMDSLFRVRHNARHVQGVLTAHARLMTAKETDFVRSPLRMPSRFCLSNRHDLIRRTPIPNENDNDY